MTRKRSFLCLFILFLCGACYSYLKKNEEFLSENERKELEAYKREVSIGRDMVGRLFQFYGAYFNDKVLSYVSDVGNYVAQFSDANERRFIFGILDTDSVHAFSTPGSYILVTYGALANMKNEAELAMFLAHEIAHVDKKHVFNALPNIEKDDLIDVQAIDPLLKKRQRNPGTFTLEAGEQISRYLSGAEGPGIGMVRASKVGLAILFHRGMSAEQEYEADRFGTQFAVRANYDPYALRNFLTRLEKNRNSVDIKLLETTHPPLLDRIRALDEELQRIHAQDILAAKGEARFLRMMEKLRR